MTFGKKTKFGRACGASSKISFFDLLFKVPYVANKPFFFKVAKNVSQLAHRQPWASEACLNANLPPPPPPPPPEWREFTEFSTFNP